MSQLRVYSNLIGPVYSLITIQNDDVCSYSIVCTFFTAYSLPLWNIVKTNPFPPLPIFTAVAFLPGTGYFLSPVNLVRSLCN